MKLITLAEICAESYKGGPGWKDIDDLRYAWITDGDTGILAIRGSANFRNWIRDFFVMPVKSWDGFWIHGGVYDAFLRLRGEVVRNEPMNRQLITTGHSLGGGIAREFGRLYREKSVTFGSLRVDWRFGAMPVCKDFRIVCDDDPVPLVPYFTYVQEGEPCVTLKDADGFRIQAGDHNIKVYIDRLNKSGYGETTL